MDKQTLSNYGWIVICTLVLAVMIALATPFGKYVAAGTQSALDGLYETAERALAVAGIYVDIDEDGIWGDDEQNTPLEAPHLQYINGKFIISGAEGADEFIVYIDGEEAGSIEEREFSLVDAGLDVGLTCKIGVKAVAAGREDSDISTIVVTVEQAQEIKLNAPTLSVRDGSFVTATIEDFANVYALYINGECFGDLPTDALNDVDFTEILPNGTYEVYVIATAPGYVDSDASNVITVEITNGQEDITSLAAPVISLNGGILEFDPVEGATEYEIYFDREYLGTDGYSNINGVDLLDAGFDDGAHELYLVAVAYDMNGNKITSGVSNSVYFSIGGGQGGELPSDLGTPAISVADGNIYIDIDENSTYANLIVNGMELGDMDVDGDIEVSVDLWLNDAGILQIGENTIVIYTFNDVARSEATTYTFTVTGDEGGNQGGEPEEPAPEITLSAPVITFNGTVCTFEEVEGAIEYDVYKNGELLGTTDHHELNGLDFAGLGLDAGDYEIYIVAKDSEGGISEMSNVVLITIA